MTDDILASYRRYRRDMEAWSHSIYGRWVTEALFAAYIELPLTDTVQIVVGYNPQKLLPSPERLMREWIVAVAEAFRPIKSEDLFISARDWATLRRGLAPNFRDLYEGFPDVTRWNDADSDPLADLQRWKEGMTGHAKPKRDWFWPMDDTPYMREGVEAHHREHTFEHKIAFVDIAKIEARMLAHLIDDRRVRAIHINIDEVDGVLPPIRDSFDVMLRQARERSALDSLFTDKPKAVSTSTGKRDMSYLKHDPTKRHKRRRR